MTEHREKQPDDGTIDPFSFSIILTTNRTLMTPCRGCGNIGPRIPYEVVDKYGNPVCLLCLKDINHSLFVMLDDYYKRFGYVGMRQQSSSGETYEGMVGFHTPEFQVDEHLNGFFRKLADILCKYRVQLAYHTNIGYKKLEGATFFLLEDPNCAQAVDQAIQEYHAGNQSEGSRILYYFFYNKAFFSKTFGISQTLPEMTMRVSRN